MADFQHTTVMAKECIEALRPALTGIDKVFVDTTLGLGGHTEAMLHEFPSIRVIAIDRDDEALTRSRIRLEPFRPHIEFVKAEFDSLAEILENLAIQGIDGILFDLGVSSLQLDDDSRGFSYHHDARIDMRMDSKQEVSAFEIVNTFSHEQLEKVLLEYGEEKFAKKIVTSIIRNRPITTTLELVEVIKSALPAYVLRKSGHPARKTFQAIRIEVNQELAQLRTALNAALEVLNPGGRIAVLTYHSLEDRIVKNLFKQLTSSSAPIDLPTVPELAPYFLVYPRGLEPSEDEVASNPRSRSARLRVLAARELAA